MTDELQTDFYQHRNWLEPSEGKAPAFWIAKFRIYPDLIEPESEPIRKIDLKRGLNIIWSPPAEEGEDENEKGRGHAAGKSAFCRALRYLLGEKTYGNRFIEERLQDSLPLHASYLAAEVWIGETQWCVFRPLNKRRKDFALKGLSIEDARKAPQSQRVEYSEFGNALAKATVAQWPVNHFDNGQTDAITWLHLLEALSRDQESHLSGIHNWRSPNSSSEPKDTSDASRAFLVRCLLGLADSKEPEILAQRAQLLERIKTAETTVTTYTRVFNDSVSAIRKAFPKLPTNIKPEDEIFVPTVKEEIGNAIANAEKKLNARVAALNLQDLEVSLQQSEKEANTIAGRIQERQEHLDRMVEDRKSFLSKPTDKKEDDSDICEQIRRSIQQGEKVCGVKMEVAQAECQLFWRCGADKLKATPEANPVTEEKEILLANHNNRIRSLTQELAPSQKAIAAAQTESTRLQKLISEKRKERDELLKEIAKLPLDETNQTGTADRIQDALQRQHDARKAIEAAKVNERHSTRDSKPFANARRPSKENVPSSLTKSSSD